MIGNGYDWGVTGNEKTFGLQASRVAFRPTRAFDLREMGLPAFAAWTMPMSGSVSMPE
jgi:hypothetical protein